MDREMLLSTMQNGLAPKCAMTKQLVVRMAYHIAQHHFALSQRHH